MSVREFVNRYYHHFNSAALKAASDAYVDHINAGGCMFLSMAGAMSTARLGISLAEMIRGGKVHAICCTGANLEEDLFNMIGRDSYVPLQGYRYFTGEQEEEITKKGLCRVTDVGIDEEKAMMPVINKLIEIWKDMDKKGERAFPHEVLYRLIREKTFESQYCLPVEQSWLIAACEKNIPIFVPGWEDSTCGNVFAAQVKMGVVSNYNIMRTGLEYMGELVEWYRAHKKDPRAPGFFQIGGGIAGDFSICVVPSLLKDFEEDDTPFWSYFCQISDSTTSYGSYSGAVPNEKITWAKLDAKAPTFVVESDATIVAPLMFSYVLDL